MKYKKLFINSKYITKNDLNLELCLLKGQVFNWRYNKIENTYNGVINQTFYKLKYNTEDSSLLYFSHSVNLNKQEIENLLIEYLDLNNDYDIYFKKWKKSKIFKKLNIKSYDGLRRINQDPFQCLISFIISQNNNIKRIESLIKSISQIYGEKIYKDYYSFPTIDILKNIKEKDLRNLSLGYRANYLFETLKKINNIDNFNKLKKMNGSDLLSELLKFKGIGSKVADCIALYGFKDDNRVPIDTHIFQIYCKFTNCKAKSPNKKLYKEIQDFYSESFNNYKPGLAQLYLFVNKINN